MKPQGDQRCAGIIQAAGASTRMGQSKALLKLENGQTLIEKQVELLQAAGCDPVRVVTGCAGEQVAGLCGQDLCVANLRWKHGRVSSIISGLRAVYPFAGCILLPVDVAGVQLNTLLTIIKHSGENVLSVRPYFQGKRGYCCWLSGKLYERVMELDSSDEKKARLDDLLRPLETRIDVDDPAVLNNLNAPGDWDAFCKAQKEKSHGAG